MYYWHGHSHEMNMSAWSAVVPFNFTKSEGIYFCCSIQRFWCLKRGHRPSDHFLFFLAKLEGIYFWWGMELFWDFKWDHSGPFKRWTPFFFLQNSYSKCLKWICRFRAFDNFREMWGFSESSVFACSLYVLGIFMWWNGHSRQFL